MPTLSLTDRTVAGLRPGTSRREYFDHTLPGFGLRVSPEGRKTWVVLFRANRRLRRLTLGTYPTLSLAEARELARGARREASLGRDPVDAKQLAQQRTFGALAELYLERHAKRHKRTWRDDARAVRRELDGWRHRPVVALKRADIRQLLDDIVERGAPIKANRVLALVRKMLNFALQHDWIDVNPAAQLPRPAPERSRDRVLSEAEIRRLWAALEAPTDDGHRRLTNASLKLRLLTGQRGGEVLAMRWRDVDVETAWWTIPAEHSKNGLTHRVPLNRLAMDVLTELRASAPIGAEHVFAGVKGKRQRAGALEPASLEDVRPHDLRRTMASHLASAGVPRLVIAKLLNHVERGVTAVYDRHSYDLEKRAALDRWGRMLQRIVNDKTSNVIVMPQDDQR